MKKFFASILCLGMIFGATGCTSGGDDTYEIAMITDSGSVTDKSFNQSAYEGVKEFGEKMIFHINIMHQKTLIKLDYYLQLMML